MAPLNCVLIMRSLRSLLILMTLLTTAVPFHQQGRLTLSNLLSGLSQHRPTSLSEHHRKSTDTHAWQKPGCHRLGHRRMVRIPGCVVFYVKTNACRGFCPSLTVPTNLTEARVTKKFLTSKSQCCSITETHNVKVKVRCQDPDGTMKYRKFTFKSAAQCSCSTCAVT